MGRRTASGLLALLACTAPLAACGAGGRGRGEPSPRVTLTDAPAVLDLSRPAVVVLLDRAAEDLEGHRLVQVDLSEVVNPSAVRLAFEVRYRSPGGEERFLGSFSLFPPHNPGEFLVPTRGELSPGGEIEVSMVPLDEPDAADELRVVVQRIALRRD